MFEKIKLRVNKKYAVISIYVVITAAIIFALAFATIQIETILRSAAGILRYIGKLLTPVFIGLIIAYIIDPMVDVIERIFRRTKFFRFKKDEKYRSLAVFFCIVVILLLIFLLLGVFVFSITKQISKLRIDEAAIIVSNYINNFSDSLKNIQTNLTDLNIEFKAFGQYIAGLSTTLVNWLEGFADNLVANTMNVSGQVSNYIFGFIIAIYLLLDKKDFLTSGEKFSKAMFTEETQKKIKNYWKDFDNIFSGYIRGQLLDVLFMSVTLSLALSIIGIKFGALIGVLAGICNVIPYFGPIVAFVGTIFFGILNAQYSKVGIAIIVLIILQQIDGNIVGPKLLGSSTSLKPVFILIAVVIGGQVGGILGMALAVPVAALLALFIRRNIEQRLQEKELLKKESVGNTDSTTV